MSAELGWFTRFGVLFVLAEVFTPYLGGFVQVQRKELADVIAKINAEEVCLPPLWPQRT